MKKISSVVLSVLMALTLFFQPANLSSFAQEEKEVVIFHTNDSHSRVEEGKYAGMGFAKVAALIDAAKQENPNVLVVDAGDTFHGQTIATLEKGESIAKIMNLVGYDAMVPGNHDFNYGSERLLELSQVVNFPVIAANVKKGEEELFTPYIIKEVDGLKIGIFGLSTPETAYMTHPNNVKGIDFADPIETAKTTVEKLEAEKVDAIIALGHIGDGESTVETSAKIAEAVNGIDIFVDGHSHTVYQEGNLVNDTLIVSTGDYTKNLGEVTLKFVDGKLSTKTAKLISKDSVAELEGKKEVAALVEEIKTGQEAILSEVVGNTPVILDGERPHVRAGETNLSDIIADSMIDLTGADVAFTNGGGIRASIDAGEITKKEIITVLPFGNYVVTKKVSGADLVAALEHGTDSYPEIKGAFPQVGGMTFKIDLNKEVGSRIVDVTVNGEAIVMDKMYVVATNDFMAAGGDGYDMLGKGELVNEYQALDEVLIAYMKKAPVIYDAPQGRMGVVEKVAETVVAPVVEETVVAPVVEAPVAVAPVSADTATYVVVPGDALWKIAAKYNTTWQNLAEINKLQNANLIVVGQELEVPAK